MKAYIVLLGKTVKGRLLAHDAADALKRAELFWGLNKYIIKPVKEQRR